jgi:hypothetical protein
VKIGRASNIAKRMRALQSASPVTLKLLAVLSTNQNDELELHKRWAHLRGQGEWFQLSDELLAFIRSRDGIHA